MYNILHSLNNCWRNNVARLQVNVWYKANIMFTTGFFFTLIWDAIQRFSIVAFNVCPSARRPLNVFLFLLWQRWKNRTRTLRTLSLRSPRAARKLHQPRERRRRVQLQRTAWRAAAPKSLNQRRHRQTRLRKVMRQEVEVRLPSFTMYIEGKLVRVCRKKRFHWCKKWVICHVL